MYCETQLHVSNSGLKSHDSEFRKIQMSLFINVAFIQKRRETTFNVFIYDIY